MTLSDYFISKPVLDQQGCCVLTFALARLSCYCYCSNSSQCSMGAWLSTGNTSEQPGVDESSAAVVSSLQLMDEWRRKTTRPEYCMYLGVNLPWGFEVWAGKG